MFDFLSNWVMSDWDPVAGTCIGTRQVAHSGPIVGEIIWSTDPVRVTVDSEPVSFAINFETGVITLLDEPAAAKPKPPAPLHPLQRLSSQPNGFGQSLWRPWE